MNHESDQHAPITNEPASREIVTSAHFSERARTLLMEPHKGVLALLTENNEIVQTEMWYALNPDDTLLMNTTKFRHKYAHLQRNPNVSLLVSRGNYQYVSMHGETSLNDDPDAAQYDIHQLAIRYLGEEAAAKIMEEEFSREERVSIILTPRRITEYFSK